MTIIESSENPTKSCRLSSNPAKSYAILSNMLNRIPRKWNPLGGAGGEVVMGCETLQSHYES